MWNSRDISKFFSGTYVLLREKGQWSLGKALNLGAILKHLHKAYLKSENHYITTKLHK